MVEWTWWALPGLASGLFSLGMAILVYLTRPDRLQNRLLALFLTLAGATWLTYSGLLQLVANAQVALAMLITMLCLHVAAHVGHLFFLATLPTRLVAPLRRPGVRALVVVCALAWILHMALRPEAWASVAPTQHVGRWMHVPGPLFAPFWWILDVLWWFGLAVSISAHANRAAWRDVRQAKAYVAAFTVHDGAFAVLLAVFLLQVPSPPAVAEGMSILPWPLLNVWLASLLAYAILRTQLFDIDLKLRKGLARGLAASLVAGAFLIVPELTERRLPVTGATWGFIAAIAVALAFKPVERLALRVLDRWFPTTPEEMAERRKRVYRDAVAELVRDGTMSEKDRQVLEVLRQRLGLSPTEAAAEQDGSGGMPLPTSPGPDQSAIK